MEMTTDTGPGCYGRALGCGVQVWALQKARAEGGQGSPCQTPAQLACGPCSVGCHSYEPALVTSPVPIPGAAVNTVRSSGRGQPQESPDSTRPTARPLPSAGAAGPQHALLGVLSQEDVHVAVTGLTPSSFPPWFSLRMCQRTGPRVTPTQLPVGKIWGGVRTLLTPTPGTARHPVLCTLH